MSDWALSFEIAEKSAQKPEQFRARYPARSASDGVQDAAVIAAGRNRRMYCLAQKKPPPCKKERVKKGTEQRKSGKYSMDNL